jgi:GTP:adenosylcobinamide-phosphate guanylyltransferase
MNAILMAGGIPAVDDPLYELSNGSSKALIPLAGKPMAQWVLDALNGAESVDQILIVGLGPEAGLHCSKPHFFLPDQGAMLTNVQMALAEWQTREPGESHVLLVSADIPAVTPEMVDWRTRVARGRDIDIDYSVVEEAVMEQRFPGANRSYIRLKDVSICGGDMNVIRLAAIKNEDFWDRVIAARKNAFKQAALIGYDTLLLILTRQLTLKKAEKMITKRLRLGGAVHISPYAEIAMDIDKLHQFEILNKDLQAQSDTHQ